VKKPVYLNKYSIEQTLKCIIYTLGVGIGAAARRAVPKQANACGGMEAKAGTAESPPKEAV